MGKAGFLTIPYLYYKETQYDPTSAGTKNSGAKFIEDH